MGVALSRSLDITNNSQETIRKLNIDSHLSFSLLPEKSFLLPQELKHAFIKGEPLALESKDSISLNFYLPHNQQVLSLSSPGMRLTDEKTPLRLIFTVLFYLGVLVLILLWLTPLVKHLIDLRETAKAFGQGDLDKRISVGSVSYINDIETEFNHMAHRIQTLVTDNKLLSSAVSHDLRTPLARLRFGIDTLAEEADPLIRGKYQARISHDLTEMEALVETLLNYARMDQSMVTLEKSSIDLAEVMNQCVESISPKEKQLNVEINTVNATIVGEKRYLLMLVNNLLQNGLRHAKNSVQISVKSIHNKVVLAVEDDGEGIPENEREKVIKPFIRGRNAQTSQGYGMGLAISKRIVDWHEGSLEISQSKTLGGAKLQITFQQR
jgi:two-component system OmpR family sensor kinase